MITWGVSAASHNAALAVFDGDRLMFASESERFSGVKNDPDLDPGLIQYARSWGDPSEIIWYERPVLKTLRQVWAGQGWQDNDVKQYLTNHGLTAPIRYQTHHRSHAAAGYFTSSWDDAVILVLDAIGEFETMSLWQAQGDQMHRLHRWIYPQSIGLWYSAMTQRVGLRANEEEYILMGMSALGDHNRFYDVICKELFDPQRLICHRNFHRGCRDWCPDLNSEQDMFDIAAATQKIYESALHRIMILARSKSQSRRLVFMGGCALNCKANRICREYFDDVWIMPAPGDSGSAIGSVLAARSRHIQWPGPYLGLEISAREPDHTIAKHIQQTGMCGLARGRAEFGPRALGNRSLLADPRRKDIRDRVNDIKQRQRFRPFAPAILAEHAHEYFDMSPGESSPYMQMTYQCRRPDLYPGIVHADGTSRVQTVGPDGSMFRNLLETWYDLTGCPMLLNTSLNIRGRPMVNDQAHARQWSLTYGVQVFT